MIIIFVDIIPEMLLMFLVLFGGAGIFYEICYYFFGPVKYLLIILLVVYSITNTIFAVRSYTKDRLLGKIIGTICNTFASVLRNGILIIFLLSIMQGMLYNANCGFWGEIWGMLAVISDGFVFFMLAAFSFGLSYMVSEALDNYNSILGIGMMNIVISYFFYSIAKSLLIGFYYNIVALLFENYPQVSQFMLEEPIIAKIIYRIIEQFI